MAKTSVLSRPLPNASLPRNSFDRDFVKNWNWSAGMLLPIFCQYVPAGSHGRINRSIFMRTAQLNTAAFPTLDHHIDFYKVPLRLLMTRYNEFKLNIGDANSSALQTSANINTPPSSMPFFSTSQYGAAIAGTGGVTDYKDILGDPIKYGADRLLDLLGYGRHNIAGDSVYVHNCNAFKLMAYQKVYFDHYRNTSYESNDPFAYNADWAYQGSGNGQVDDATLRKYLTIRYVNYRKDFFQNIYPALNYVSSSPSGTNWQIPSSVLGFGSAGSNVESVAISNTNGGITFDRVPLNSVTGFSSVSAQGLRSLFALDKLLRASAYAPKHVKDQLQARYGVKSSAIKSNESEFLGSFMNSVQIGEVTSTANTVGLEEGSGGDHLGAIGGKGVSGSTGGKTIEFDTFDDDCIIIGMSYTLVRSMYDSDRVDAFNMKFSREDIFVPEFMNLGLRPVTRMELREVASSGAAAANTAILGYVPRDEEYKLGIDENHGLFRYGYMLDVFSNHTNQQGRGNFSGTTNGLNAAYFKTSPKDLDSIFESSYSAASELTDQFFGQVRFFFQCRQNMSVHGQPSL